MSALKFADLEWSSFVDGAPYDTRMGATYDGPRVRACPICRGADPSENRGKAGLIEAAFGHRPGCKMAAAVKNERG